MTSASDRMTMKFVTTRSRVYAYLSRQIWKSSWTAEQKYESTKSSHELCRRRTTSFSVISRQKDTRSERTRNGPPDALVSALWTAWRGGLSQPIAVIHAFIGAIASI